MTTLFTKLHKFYRVFRYLAPLHSRTGCWGYTKILKSIEWVDRAVFLKYRIDTLRPEEENIGYACHCHEQKICIEKIGGDFEHSWATFLKINYISISFSCINKWHCSRQPQKYRQFSNGVDSIQVTYPIGAILSHLTFYSTARSDWLHRRSDLIGRGYSESHWHTFPHPWMN